MRISDWSSDVCSSDLVMSTLPPAAGQLADVAGGSVDMTFVSYAGAKAFIDAGKVKALAVTSDKRASFAPEIPDRTSVVSGKSVSVRVDLGGRRILKKQRL